MNRPVRINRLQIILVSSLMSPQMDLNGRTSCGVNEVIPLYTDPHDSPLEFSSEDAKSQNNVRSGFTGRMHSGESFFTLLTNVLTAVFSSQSSGDGTSSLVKATG